MIETIRKCFDDFVVAARIKPAVTAGLPILLMVLYKGIINSQWTEAGVGLALSTVIISFAAYIIREFGKTYEEKMYAELNGKPSTIILRFSDNTIDDITKQKYHQYINQRFPELHLPVSLEDEKNDLQADNQYESAIHNIRIYANSHREALPRVYQELKKYHFWRNLYGSKWYVLGIYIFLILRELIVLGGVNIRQMFLKPFPQYGILILLLGWSVMFCCVVTKKTVKRNAFDYAKTLLETIDFMSENQ